MSDQRAYYAVWKAIQAGALAPLDGHIPCMDCGAPEAQYDHRDYNRPLDVEPVCGSCNRNRGPAIPYRGRATSMRGSTFILPDRAMAELGMYAAGHFTTISKLIHGALLKQGIIKAPWPVEPKGGKQKN